MFDRRIAWLAAAGVAIGITVLDAPPAAAEARATEWSAQSTQRPRVEIRPGRLYHRECVDGYREVVRPYWGKVVMPYMRCWWVRG
jgi:hypothetical protein